MKAAQPTVQMLCTLHPHFPLTHGCIKEDCQYDSLFCSECLIEQLDHLTAHRQHIQPLPKFLQELAALLQKTTQLLKPLEPLGQQIQSGQSYFQNYVLQQKESVNLSLKALCDEFFSLIESSRNRCFQAIDQHAAQVTAHLDQKKKTTLTDDLLKVQTVPEFHQALNALDHDKKVQFIYQLKSQLASINNNAIHQQTQIDSIQKCLRQIRNNSDVLKVDLVAGVQSQMHQLHSEMAAQMKKLVQNMTTKSCLNEPPPAPPTINTSYRPTNKSISYSKSPVNKNSSYKPPPFPNNSQLSIIPKLDSNDQSMLNTSHNKNKPPSKPMPAATNLLNLRVDLRNNFNGTLKFDLQKEGGVQAKQGALSMVQLHHNQVAVAYKDGSIGIVQLGDREHNQVCMLIDPSTKNNPIYSLATLTAYQDSQMDNQYMAAAHEQNGIAIWEYNWQIQQGKVVAWLQDDSGMVEGLRVVMQMTPGTLLAGDVNGTLSLWDYNSTQLLERYSMHNQAITQIIGYDQGRRVAVGAQDRLISLWEVQAQDMLCMKVVKNEGEIYCIREMGEHLVVSDSRNRARLLDWTSCQWGGESQALINGEYIQQMLQVDFLTQQATYPLLLCFTRQGLILMDGDTLEGLQYFDSLHLNLLDHPGHLKVLFQPSGAPNRLSLVLLNQGPRHSDTLGLYSLNF